MKSIQLSQRECEPAVCVSVSVWVTFLELPLSTENSLMLGVGYSAASEWISDCSRTTSGCILCLCMSHCSELPPFHSDSTGCGSLGWISASGIQLCNSVTPRLPAEFTALRGGCLLHLRMNYWSDLLLIHIHLQNRGFGCISESGDWIIQSVPVQKP